MITIEPARVTDANELYDLYSQWDRNKTYDRDVFETSLRAVLGQGNDRIFTAKENGLIVGYMEIANRLSLGHEPYYEVVALLVSENNRSSGIGKLLLDKAEDIARRDRVRFVKLSSQLHRSRAHVFYEKHGYECYKYSKFFSKTVITP